MTRPVPLRRRLLTAAILVLLGLAAAAPAPARAADNDLVIRNLAQDEFRQLAREIGIGLSAFQARPAAPLGFLRFDAGVEVTAVDIDEKRAFWSRAFADGDAPSVLPVPKVHVDVGLPLGIDLGALYSYVPDSNIRLWGAEAKWAIIRGGAVWPAVAVRGGYTSLEGVDELELTTKSVDASISKGFGPVTPYVGIGRIWIEAEPKGAAAAPPAGLVEVNPVEDRVFAGLRLRLALLSLVAEASWSRVPAYTLRLNVSF